MRRRPKFLPLRYDTPRCRDFVGCRVELVRAVTLKSGKAYPKGFAFEVLSTFRGKFTLINNHDAQTSRSRNMCDPNVHYIIHASRDSFRVTIDWKICRRAMLLSFQGRLISSFQKKELDRAYKHYPKQYGRESDGVRGAEAARLRGGGIP